MAGREPGIHWGGEGWMEVNCHHGHLEACLIRPRLQGTDVYFIVVVFFSWFLQAWWRRNWFSEQPSSRSADTTGACLLTAWLQCQRPCWEERAGTGRWIVTNIRVTWLAPCLRGDPPRASTPASILLQCPCRRLSLSCSGAVNCSLWQWTWLGRKTTIYVTEEKFWRTIYFISSRCILYSCFSMGSAINGEIAAVGLLFFCFSLPQKWHLSV